MTTNHQPINQNATSNPARIVEARIQRQKTGFRTKAIGVMVVAALLCTPLAGFAGMRDFLNRRGDRGPNPDAIRIVMQIAKEVRSIMEDLNVTDAQRAAIQTSIKQTKPQAETLHQQLKAKRDLLRQQLVANPNDSTRIDQLAGELAVVESQMVRLRVQRIAAAARELTPEQRQRIAQGTSKIEDLVGELRDEFENGTK
ncbi:MAG: periplasmic heavy metal sensor [Blastocatellia bacterium]|nr:periplasmic heavy metal sensor [Blastocatellia bacterium]